MLQLLLALLPALAPLPLLAQLPGPNYCNLLCTEALALACRDFLQITRHDLWAGSLQKFQQGDEVARWLAEVQVWCPCAACAAHVLCFSVIAAFCSLNSPGMLSIFLKHPEHLPKKAPSVCACRSRAAAWHLSERVTAAVQRVQAGSSILFSCLTLLIPLGEDKGSGRHWTGSSHEGVMGGIFDILEDMCRRAALFVPLFRSVSSLAIALTATLSLLGRARKMPSCLLVGCCKTAVNARGHEGLLRSSCTRESTVLVRHFCVCCCVSEV